MTKSCSILHVRLQITFSFIYKRVGWFIKCEIFYERIHVMRTVSICEWVLPVNTHVSASSVGTWVHIAPFCKMCSSIYIEVQRVKAQHLTWRNLFFLFTQLLKWCCVVNEHILDWFYQMRERNKNNLVRTGWLLLTKYQNRSSASYQANYTKDCCHWIKKNGFQTYLCLWGVNKNTITKERNLVLFVQPGHTWHDQLRGATFRQIFKGKIKFSDT